MATSPESGGIGGGVILIDVLGTPAPKGSNRAMVRGGRAVFVPGGSKTNQEKLKSWDGAVRAAASEIVGDVAAPPFVDCGLCVSIVFRMARPAGHWGKHGLKPSAPPSPRTKPDIDKLVRCTLDSLIGTCFDDDSRIVRLVATKTYADPGKEGARIEIEEWKS